jgi:hypothetical protein
MSALLYYKVCIQIFFKQFELAVKKLSFCYRVPLLFPVDTFRQITANTDTTNNEGALDARKT